MPAAKGQTTGLLARLGDRFRKAHEAHKDDTTVVGGGDLPPGIENGVARLSQIKFGQFETGDNKGKDYVMMFGTVMEPEYAEDENGNQMKVRGLTTKWGPEPLCDTPNRASRKTFDEHVQHWYTYLRSIGMETSEVDADNLETSCEALVEVGPTFRFRTWKGKPTEQFPNPQVNHQWQGRIEYADKTEPGSGVDDASPAAPAAKPSANGKAPAAVTAGRPGPKPKPAPAPAAKAGPKPGAKKAPEPEPAPGTTPTRPRRTRKRG